MLLDCRALVNISPAAGEYDVEACPFRSPALDITAPEPRFDYLGATEVLGDQLVPLGLVNDEGLIQTRLDAVIYASLNILAQGCALAHQSFKEPHQGWVFQNPSFLSQEHLGILRHFCLLQQTTQVLQ